MRSDLHSLYPKIYRDILETDILCDVQDPQFNRWFEEMDAARLEQFVLTASERGIAAFERIYEIRANPLTEDLEFRRKRVLLRMRLRIPFTFRFLLQRLDEIIGPGNYHAWLSFGDWNYLLGRWKLGEHPFQDEPYTLHIEAAVPDANWYHEVYVFLNKIKPANIVYAMSPRVTHNLEMGETIGTYPLTWNYKLGQWKLGAKRFLTDTETEAASWNYAAGTWSLGKGPFGEKTNMEVVKVPEMPSIQAGMEHDHALFSAQHIAAVRLNKTHEIRSLYKYAEGSNAVIRYTVPKHFMSGDITEIELLREDGAVLSACKVYVPMGVSDMVTLKHIIKHKEVASLGVSNPDQPAS